MTDGDRRVYRRELGAAGIHWAGVDRRGVSCRWSQSPARWSGKSSRIPFAMATAAALMLLTGCLYLPSKNATGRVLVVGLGLVSIHAPPNQALVATSSQVLGLRVSDRPGLKVGFGYSSGVVTTVAEGAEDVRAEVSLCPFGPLSVKIQKAVLESRTDSSQSGESP